MVERRYLPPRFGHSRKVDFGEGIAPGIDDQRMAETGGGAFDLAVLARRDHVAAMFDRPGAVQHVPVRLARHLRERRRSRQHGRAVLGEQAV